MSMTVTILFITISFLLIPDNAWAWGIGIHLQLGSFVLENLVLLPPAVQALLGQYPNDYLYGCISADITLGKKYTHYLKHCHSWRMGKNILAAADSDPRKACAYGYLSHLAADTIAHSYFVPYKLIRTYNTVLLKHAYWEMRFEGHVNPEIWPLARSIARKDFSANDAMMREVLSDTIFSFNTNKRLFNSLMLLNRLQHWQKMLRSLANTSKYRISEEDQHEYLGLAQQATLDLISDLDGSQFLNADPTGERAFHTAGIIRKNLNLLWLDGKIREVDTNLMLNEIKGRLREGITRPDELLELLSEF